MQERKLGEGHAAAMARLGLKELRNAVNPSKESAADHEIGLYGTVSQGTAADQQGYDNRKDEQGQEAQQQKSVLGYDLPSQQEQAGRQAQQQNQNQQQQSQGRGR